MTLTCPKCGKQIESASVNVAHDAAFCAPCGIMHKISELTAAQPAKETAAEKPDERFCAKCRTQLREGAHFCDFCGAPYEPPPAYKAEFTRSGDGIYACGLYMGEDYIGTIPQIKDEFLPDTKKWLETVYPGVEIEMK